MNWGILSFVGDRLFVLPWRAVAEPGTLARAISRVPRCAASILLAMLLGGVPATSTSATAADIDGAEPPFVCVPARLTVLAVYEDSVRSGMKSGEHAYREISRGLLFRSFVQRIADLEDFGSISRSPERPYNSTLNFRIDRLQRRPISSPDDMWLDVSLDLRERQQNRSLWTKRFAIHVEARDLGSRREPDVLFYRLLTHLAAQRLAVSAARELDTFLAGRSRDEHTEDSLWSCPARSVVGLGLTGLPMEDEREVLRSLSRSPCYELAPVSGDSVAGPDRGILWIEARSNTNDLIQLKVLIPGVEDHEVSWQAGDARTRDAVLQDVQAEVAAYHHRNSTCTHGKAK